MRELSYRTHFFMKLAKRIEFKFEIDGEGIVNYDSNSQKWVWNTLEGKTKVNHDNVMLGKKVFFENEGKLQYKLAISANALRHEIFKKGMPFQNQSLTNNDTMLVRTIANPTSFIRGYLFTSPKYNIKRSSAISITSAIQTNAAISNIETFNKSGEKIDINDNKTDNSFYKKEICGKISYGGSGIIDLSQLRFLSCDPAYDRLGLVSDHIKLYVDTFKEKMPSLDVKEGYYQIKDSVFELSECGLYFSDENIVLFVKEFFKNLLSLNIAKSGAFAKIKSIKYKIISDTIANLNEKNENWISIYNENDVDKISFTPDFFYEERDFEDTVKLKEQLKKDKEEMDKLRGEKKNNKKKNKEDKE